MMRWPRKKPTAAPAADLEPVSEPIIEPPPAQRLRFQPEPDITAYELAMILRRVCGGNLIGDATAEIIEEFGLSRRHWRPEAAAEDTPK